MSKDKSELMLSDKQLKLLKLINRKPDCNFLSASDSVKARLYYLKSKNLISILYSSENKDVMAEATKCTCKVTELGEAYLFGTRSNDRRWLITLIISIFSAIGAYREEMFSIILSIVQILKNK